MHQPAERDRGALFVVVLVGLAAVARSRSSVVARRRSRQPKPAATTSADERQQRRGRSPTASDVAPGQRRREQRRHAQQRVADHAAEAGRQRPARALRQAGRESRTRAACRRARSTAAAIRGRAGDASRAASPRPRPAAPARSRRGRTTASAGRRRWRRGVPSRLRTGASVAWLKHGSCTDQVASAHRDHRRQRDQREAADLAQAAAQRARAGRRSRKLEAVETAVDRMHHASVSPARRRGDAAPRPWFPCPAPWRRGYSRRRDCGRRRRRARDSCPGMTRTPASRQSFSVTASSPPYRADIEPEEKAAGRTLVAVAVADDLVGEIEFRAIELAVLFDMRFVVIGRDRDVLQRHRHLRRGDVAQLEKAARGSAGRRRRSRRAGPAGSSASTANGTRRRWRNPAPTLRACRRRLSSRIDLRIAFVGEHQEAVAGAPAPTSRVEIGARRRPRPAGWTARRDRTRPCAPADRRRARRDRAGSRSRASAGRNTGSQPAAAAPAA